jgi:hypothetical protein
MSLGARMIPRMEFTRVLNEHVFERFEPTPWDESGSPSRNEAPATNV